MYSELQHLTTERQVEFLTRKLIEIESYNGTKGETLKANWLFEVLQSFPYFQTNPEQVWKKNIGDELGRENVFAFIKGKEHTAETIIYFAHLDTVGTEDFGPIQSIAHKPDELQDYFSTYEGDEEVQKDAKSGDWLFGRGSLDMQSGIAVHLVNALYFTENLEELKGNILIMFNPDEESQHTGIRSALKELIRLKEHLNLEYITAINNDFISPLFDHDEMKYIYTGTAGKLLPCFYIFGREAHVGDSLTAIDPTLIGSELVREISQNFKLVEQLDDELVLPPSCLYLRDDKKSYDVQTAVSAKVYFNYFVYEKSPKAVMDDLLSISKHTCRSIEIRQADNYEKFRQTNDLPERELDFKVDVISLEDYIAYLEGLGIETKKIMNVAFNEANRDILDDRMVAFQMVEALQNADPEKRPRVILFYAPPYLPANFLQLEKERNQLLYNVIKKELSKEIGEQFKLRRYFPYLSDGSFLSFDGTDEDIQSLIANFPGMEQLFPLPLKDMTLLSIPAINFGVYGKSGHKWTERVYKPYTFEVLPKLIRNVTMNILNKMN
ncbi:M20/M25/M40 family metallo-hydrolase [Bacillus sp. 31A1R]|uniref:M20/M25/M40 family metallo-hydrolase n=1 Tax=Robertmurraya mangrovi TaxID=3098077 RepID=A0ABU5J3I4_9BACI|nr:M20/M25/M40 family metallo-hydrolase [Bacillus sp. 31A1R]MDZ5473964.1 M20/M25/M40 family metallo-hydrolase [Bacillus sp. 31A1R]